MKNATPRPMRVLVVATQEPWPLDHGGRLRLFHFVKQLAHVAEVTLALPGAARHAAKLPQGVRVVAMAPCGNPGCSANSSVRRVSATARLARRHFGHNPAIDAWLRQNARPAFFDVAFFSGAPLGLHVSATCVPVVWDGVDELVLYTVRDAQHGSWRRWPGALRRALLYALYERDAARQAAATVFTSPVDAAYARRWTGEARVEVVSIGVDLEYFRPCEAAPRPGTVAFVGSLEFPPNVDGIVDFARRIWPRIYAQAAGRRLLVVGRRPVSAVRMLASLPGVELAADAPDVRPYLARASAVVVPTRQGGGVKNKILEGCAMCRPVVASPRALGGLNVRVGVELLSADKPRDWVERVGRLLERPAYARKTALAGHNWVLRTHRWSTIGNRLVEILASVRHGSRRSGLGGAPRSTGQATRFAGMSDAGPAGHSTRGAEDHSRSSPDRMPRREAITCGAAVCD